MDMRKSMWKEEGQMRERGEVMLKRERVEGELCLTEVLEIL